MQGLYKNHGIIALEVLVGLGLSLIVVCVILVAIQSFTALYLKLRQEQQSNIKANTIRELLVRGISNSEVNSGIEGIRLHPAGKVLDIFGSPINKAMSSPHSIEKNNTAISFISLNQSLVFHLINLTEVSDQYKFELCLTAQQTQTPSLQINSYRRWLAVSLDGYVELNGQIRNAKQTTNRCKSGKIYSGVMQIAKPLLFANSTGKRLQAEDKTNWPNLIVLSASILLPIKECYTLYLDNNHTLRRLSHSTEDNQPVIRDISKLVIYQDNKTKLLEAEVTVFKDKKPRKKEFNLPLPSPLTINNNYLNFLF